MFDAALKDICSEGLSRGLPINASVVLDKLSAKFPRFEVSRTPFERTGNLLIAAENDNLIRLGRRGDEQILTWLKYKYRLVEPATRCRRVARPTSAPRRGGVGRNGRGGSRCRRICARGQRGPHTKRDRGRRRRRSNSKSRESSDSEDSDSGGSETDDESSSEDYTYSYSESPTPRPTRVARRRSRSRSRRSRHHRHRRR